MNMSRPMTKIIKSNAYPVPLHLPPLEFIFEHTPIEVVVKRLRVFEAVLVRPRYQVSTNRRAEGEAVLD